MIGRSLALLALVTAAGLGACTREGTEDFAGAEGEMSPVDRLIAGRAAEYPADPSLNAALPRMLESQVARRAAAWEIARKVLAPVRIDGAAQAIPRFQTWYSKEEITPIFDHLLKGQPGDEVRQKRPPSAAAIEEAFAWEVGRVTSGSDWTEERRQRRLAELERDGFSSLGGNERVLMSPALAGHLFAHYDSILGCTTAFPGPHDAPPSETNFAPCVGEEFPAGAAIVKAVWVPEILPLEAHDTSAEALSTTLAAGEWGPAPRTARPDEQSIYTLRLPSGMRVRLAALHVITKETRDWMWVSLFWSDTPNQDFGADRPADFTGPLANYKMCAVVGFDELDAGPEKSKARAGRRLPESLERALDATRAFGPRTWCSNPYLEHGPGNATTNCIGCHQHAGTDLRTESILERFPDGAREKLRSNFPADYTFITSTGLELGSLMKAIWKSKVDGLPPR